MAIRFAPARRRRGQLVARDRFLFTPEWDSVMDSPHSPPTESGGRVMRFRNLAMIVLWTMLSGPVLVQPTAGDAQRVAPVRAAGAAKAHKITVSAKPQPPPPVPR
jgi:hypothetical protein